MNFLQRMHLSLLSICVFGCSSLLISHFQHTLGRGSTRNSGPHRYSANCRCSSAASPSASCRSSAAILLQESMGGRTYPQVAITDISNNFLPFVHPSLPPFVQGFSPFPLPLPLPNKLVHHYDKFRMWQTHRWISVLASQWHRCSHPDGTRVTGRH